MEISRTVSRASALLEARSRRGVFGLLAASGLSRLVLDEAESRKKHKKRKKKPACGKNGSKPIRGKCCANTVAVDGTCRTCDVCASGCAFATLQVAIDAAGAGATLAVCPGTYAGGLTLAKNLRLVGDSNEGSATVVRGAGDASVVKVTMGTITLQNLRLTGGGGDGAGLYIEAGTVTLIGCAVSENTGASGAYAAIFNGGSLQLTNTNVSGNTASNGGGIFNVGPLQLTNSSVSGNEASGGGGIYNIGTLQLTNSVISGNTGQVGGGIYNSGSVLFDSASRVTGNTASLTGGGIYKNAGTVTLASSANVNLNNPNNCAGTSAIALCNG
ncbi:MAG: hypothetical protein U0075_06135 [Thermomicrobiales bacterium]